MRHQYSSFLLSSYLILLLFALCQHEVSATASAELFSQDFSSSTAGTFLTGGTRSLGCFGSNQLAFFNSSSARSLIAEPIYQTGRYVLFLTPLPATHMFEPS